MPRKVNNIVQVYLRSDRELSEIQLRATVLGKSLSAYFRDLAVQDLYLVGIRGMMDTKENLALVRQSQLRGEEDSTRFLVPNLATPPPAPSPDFDEGAYKLWLRAQEQEASQGSKTPAELLAELEANSSPSPSPQPDLELDSQVEITALDWDSEEEK